MTLREIFQIYYLFGKSVPKPFKAIYYFCITIFRRLVQLSVFEAPFWYYTHNSILKFIFSHITLLVTNILLICNLFSQQWIWVAVFWHAIPCDLWTATTVLEDCVVPVFRTLPLSTAHPEMSVHIHLSTRLRNPEDRSLTICWLFRGHGQSFMQKIKNLGFE